MGLFSKKISKQLAENESEIISINDVCFGEWKDYYDDEFSLTNMNLILIHPKRKEVRKIPLSKVSDVTYYDESKANGPKIKVTYDAGAATLFFQDEDIAREWYEELKANLE